MKERLPFPDSFAFLGSPGGLSPAQEKALGRLLAWIKRRFPGLAMRHGGSGAGCLRARALAQAGGFRCVAQCCDLDPAGEGVAEEDRDETDPPRGSALSMRLLARRGIVAGAPGDCDRSVLREAGWSRSRGPVGLLEAALKLRRSRYAMARKSARWPHLAFLLPAAGGLFWMPLEGAERVSKDRPALTWKPGVPPAWKMALIEAAKKKERK